MPLTQPDLLVRDTLSAGFDGLLRDPSPIRDVFAGRPQDEVAAIVDWFGGNAVKVALGFPRNAAELPGVFVFLMTSTEARQVVGAAFPERDGDPTPDDVSEYGGSYFNTGVRAACWAVNADLVVWMQNLALSFLLAARHALNAAGLHEQSITAADFGPLPQWFPDFAFRRDLTLTALHPETFKSPFPKIKEVDVAAQAVSDPTTYRAVLRTRR